MYTSIHLQDVAVILAIIAVWWMEMLADQIIDLRKEMFTYNNYDEILLSVYF